MSFYLDVRTSTRWGLRSSGTDRVSGIGSATLELEIPNDPALLGFTSYWQGFVWDPGAELPNQVSYTPGLKVTVIR